MQKQAKIFGQFPDEFAMLCQRPAGLDSLDLQHEMHAEGISEAITKLLCMLDCAPSGIHFKDLDGKYLFVNEQFAKLFHLDREQIVGLTDREIFSADVAELFRSHEQKALEKGAPLTFEEEVLQEDGPHFFQTTRYPFQDAQGRTVGVCGVCVDMTLLKMKEETLRENEQKCRAIFDQTYQFIGLLTPDGTLVEANRTAMQFSGVEPKDVLGKPFWETPWWTHSKAVQDRLKEAIQQAAAGMFVRFEATHKSSDGQMHHIDFSLKPVRNDKGEVVYLIPEGRDITEHKSTENELEQYREHLEAMVEERTASLEAANQDLKREMQERRVLDEALRESERKIRTLMDNLPGMAYRCKNDRKWTMEFVSDGCMELTGYEPRDLIGNRTLSYAELIHEEDRDKVWDTIEDALDENRRFKLTYRIASKKGQTKWVLEQGIGVFSEGGELLALEGFISDITDRKMAEQELRKHRDHLEELVLERTSDLIESEEKYRTLVENVPLVTYRISLHGEVLFINDFVEEVFGYKPQEIFKKPELFFEERILAEDLGVVKELREKSLRNGQEFLAEYRIRHKRGQVVYVMDHAIPFEAPNGRIRGLAGIIMDITSRVRLRDELIRAEEQKTITEVSARLAHEIRNPLMSAGGFARRLLSSMPKDDPNRPKVEIIVKEVGRLETILRMILNYLQPVQLCLSMHDPNQLLENALNAVDAELKESHTEIQLDLDKGLSKIHVDQLQMELVLETLIKQAINQIKDGGKLSIATSSENGMVKLLMTYPLKHVSRDDIEHFFYPFTSTEKAHDTADLPLSKIVIAKHGGDIDVKLEKPDQLILKITLPEIADEYNGLDAQGL